MPKGHARGRVSKGQRVVVGPRIAMGEAVYSAGCTRCLVAVYT